MAQATLYQSTRWQEIVTIWQDNRWLFVVAGWLLGILTFPFVQQIAGDGLGLLNNLVPEAISILFTVLILDRLAENRATEQLQQRLVREAGSRDNSTALAATEWLRDEDWLEGAAGLLQGTFLEHANLAGANLSSANLQKTILLAANLEGADIQQANLQHAYLAFANLRKTNLSRANLQGTDMVNAQLERAFLQLSNLTNADLGGANLKDVDLSDARIEGAIWESRRDFMTFTAIMPDGRKWTADTDVTRYTDRKHPDFWQPEWVQGHQS